MLFASVFAWTDRARYTATSQKFDKVDEKFAAILEKLGDLKVWTIMVVGGGLLSIVARAFHWI